MCWYEEGRQVRLPVDQPQHEGCINDHEVSDLQQRVALIHNIVVHVGQMFENVRSDEPAKAFRQVGREVFKEEARHFAVCALPIHIREEECIDHDDGNDCIDAQYNIMDSNIRKHLS